MLEFVVDLRGVERGLSEMARKQLPFATALALTETAGEVGLSWQDEMRQVLDRPTPFTVNAVAVRPARKTRLIASVYLKDVAAEYLEPFIVGGLHFLGKKRAILAPKAVPLNAYGNLPRTKIATLKARKDVFVGGVRLRSGQVVHGVWQRAKPKRGAAAHGGGALKLLIRFDDPLPVQQHLNFKRRADETVRAVFAEKFARAFNHAMATAR